MGEKTEFTRREFLKLAGATTGMAVAGCAGEVPEKLIPYVVQPDDAVPGVALWYAGACFQCPAACGVLVRTREGRAVKMEGNPLHPVNRGALCARGQSVLQTLYDPDRIKHPLRKNKGAFSAERWPEAVAAVSEALAQAGRSGRKSVLITKRLSLSEADLVREFCAAVPGLEHIEYELFEEPISARAAELVFGAGKDLRCRFDAADYLLSIGADYLGTWGSPVEQARAVAGAHAGGRALRTVHVEPRLSLTAANADHWICSRFGAEAAILEELVRRVAALKGTAAPGASQLMALLAFKARSPEETGLSEMELARLSRELSAAQAPLVLAGGAAVSSRSALRCAILAHVLNVLLGAVGKTVFPVPGPGVAGGYGKLARLAEEAQAGTVPALIITAAVNPLYTLPEGLGFRQVLRKTPLTVSLALNLDETAEEASLVLPLSTALESWGDARPRENVFSLNQPAMQPLYPTQSLGDTLISIAAAAPLNVRFGKSASYYDYIRMKWAERTGEADFEERWLNWVELGGEFRAEPEAQVQWSPHPELGAAFSAADARREEGESGLALLAFPTVVLGDGSGSNRPWLQELRDPISTAVWSSWLELHPETAGRHGLREGDAARVITASGVLEGVVHITRHIDPRTVAMPIGQGHRALGRFAAGIGANPLAALEAGSVSGGLRFSAPVRRLERLAAARAVAEHDKLVVMQGSDSQHGRKLLRTVMRGSKEPLETPGGHAGEEGRPQMYKRPANVLRQWGMIIDLNKCTGCSACVVACYAENNVPVVGKRLCAQGREMSWIRIERYLDGPAHRPVTGFMPMLCQHCANAPCEPVCPVYATYHNDEGLNAMVYNRCVGTRYCANNCSYKVRRFNWAEYSWPEPLNWQLNPDVTVRSVGVMEKCTFCVQRIREAENRAKDLDRPLGAGEVLPACAATCPAGAITFGSFADESGPPLSKEQARRGYKVLDEELNTQPAITYLARIVDEDKTSEA